MNIRTRGVQAGCSVGRIPPAASKIYPCGYLNSRSPTPAKYKWTVTLALCYSFCTFDEKLQEHISHDLADADGRASDTS